MNVAAEQTTTITLTLTSAEAARIIADFDQRREPSIPGKSLYMALVKARGKTVSERISEAYYVEPHGHCSKCAPTEPTAKEAPDA